MKKCLLLLGLLVIFSCNRNADPNKILVENNFDGLHGWGSDHTSVTSERAHSGKYAVKIDENIEFGLAFNQILGSLTNKKPKRINVELWAYISSEEAKATFVSSLIDPKTNQKKFWQDFNLVDKTKDYREWVKITKRLDLPADTELSDRFNCYLWRPENSKEAVYIDDLKITILE